MAEAQVDAIFLQIEETFEDLQRATEYRDYAAFNALLDRQRSLLQSVPPSHPRTMEFVIRGRELVNWATIMVKIQRSSYARSLAAILARKQLNSTYRTPAEKCAEIVSFQA